MTDRCRVLEWRAAAQRLLREDAPVGEANRVWLRRRLDAGDWIAGDALRLREMMASSQRSCLTRFRADEGPCQ